LGGGGHTRAAAAPVPADSATTNSVAQRILELITQSSRSAITVADIMSSGRPQSLDMGMSIADAADLMRRYGHEGFPVLRIHASGHEELLGVLTRREADRALNHQMGSEPVSRFMRAGQVSVRPDDTVTHLRKVMIQSGWGQIPVVDAHGQMVGIVTRTDLIKLWDESSLPSRHASAVAGRLKRSLTPVQHALLQLIGIEVDRLNFSVYVVGGFVRDLLLNHSAPIAAALDMDIVIEGNAIEFSHRMAELYGGRIVAHRKFNTAKWLLTDDAFPVQWETLVEALDVAAHTTDLPAHLDFVTARTEFYTAPTVLPTVESSSIKLDLHRRDFTINTLALCLNPDRWGELLDYYGGAADLSAGVIRVLHSLSFLDDPTRILRAVRYEQRFTFAIEPRTLELLHDAIELLDRVSGARLRHEFERILAEEEPEKTLQRLDELAILARIHPELRLNHINFNYFPFLRSHMAGSDAPQELKSYSLSFLYWGLLAYWVSPASVASLSERLDLSSQIRRLIAGIVRLRIHVPQWVSAQPAPSEVVRLLSAVELPAIYLAQVLFDQEPQVGQLLDRYLQQWRTVRPDLDGNDLHALGIPRGPVYGEILTQLKAARLDNQLHNRKDELEWVAQYRSAHSI
jgi:tRNA nucleotidyltransferase (CCA-adding enzyme)